MNNETLGRLVRLLVTISAEWLGIVCDVVEKLASHRGSEWYEELKKFAHREPCWVAVTEAVEKAKIYLRRLYETETITVGATDGTETIPGLSASGHATEAANVIVDEQAANGKFAELFGSKGPVRRRWTRSQVSKFATDNPTRLRRGCYGNFFELDDGSVAVVDVFGGGRPSAVVCGFGGDCVWGAGYRHRVFSLQQVA